jgi:hypothetical protein
VYLYLLKRLTDMKQTIRSMYAQVAYMTGMGLGLLLVPDLLLTLLGMPPAADGWIRVLGALALTFAGYYFTLTRLEYAAFFHASVWGRYFFCSCLVVLAATGLGPRMLYLFAAAEALLAAWTQISLRRGQGT